MNSQFKLKNVTITLDENQLCTLITAFNEGWISAGESNRSDIKELRKILRNALAEVID